MRVKKFNHPLSLFIPLLVFVFIFCTTTNAQNAKSDATKTATPAKDTVKNRLTTIEAYYGYKSYFNNFQKQLNTAEKFKTGNPVQLAGFGLSGYYDIDKSSAFYGHLLYTQVIPQTVHVNDSIACKLTGFVFSAAYGGAVHTASKNFYTLFYFGFNTGRLRFYGDEEVKQKNPFFSPKLGIQPKLLIGKFTVTLIAEAEYDVSKTGWRRTKYANADKTDISNFRQSGVTTLIGVSYRLFNYEDDPDDFSRAQ